MAARPLHDSGTTDLQRQQFRAQLATALSEEDDPLAVYDKFVQWTINNYGENNPNSGLLELLEQATQAFKEDPVYKADLRYLKLWCLYASQVDRSRAISTYAYLLANEIGTSYSVLYENYATLLESDGRQHDAENLYRKGLKRQARPVERLKARYREFQTRFPSSKPSVSSTVSSSSASAKSRPVSDSRRSQSKSTSAPTSAPPSKSSPVFVSSTREARYAYMLAPPDPGKRPEKLRFDLSLLFTEDNVEYSIQEARARSMGLLGKKWGPLPTSESSRFALVDFNDDGQRSTRITSGRKSVMGGAEPTVTINTKEALADVFGIYNSPEKATRLMGIPGSKHAPLKKVEPRSVTATPRVPLVAQRNENPSQNENVQTPTPAFRPFVDENASSSGIAPKQKFTPYVDPSLVANQTPLSSRPALGLKGSGSKISKLPSVSEVPPENTVSKVFFPAEKARPQEYFSDDEGPLEKSIPSNAGGKPQNDVPLLGEDGPRPSTFTPFVDEDAKSSFRVFSRPPEPRITVSSQNIPVFTPAVDSRPIFTPFRDAPVAFKPCKDQHYSQSVDGTLPRNDIEEESQQGAVDEDFEEVDAECEPCADQFDDAYGEGESYQEEEMPLGGRFGKFNVMTPIAERTYEFTSTTRIGYTPNDRRESGHNQNFIIPPQRDWQEAAMVAKQLADELKGDVNEDVDEPLEPLQLSVQPLAVNDVEKKTGQLSFGDILALNASFRPPNPCNPFSRSLLESLLLRIPTDPQFYDFGDRDSNMLDDLQRFTKKASRKSGDTSEGFPLVLDGHRFSVSEKLGEGGFGAVFKAKDLGSQRESDDSGDDLDDADEELEEEASLVAVKIVKPRNIWEYHILRRLHSVLPVPLRRSVILPHALYAFRDESFLILNCCTQGTLLDIVNGAAAAGVSQQGACLDELLVFFFTIELLRLLEACHNIGFIHGDLKIDNCLLRLEEVPGGVAAWTGTYQPSGEGGWNHKGLKVIDFGRTIDTRLFPADQQYIADWDTDERDCFEARDSRPWTYQADYFGLAGIIYCMLFGKYIQASSIADASKQSGPRYKITTPLKRYWQGDLWSRLFDVLLNPCLVKPDGQLPVSETLGELRCDMENWLQANCNRTSGTLKGLLKKVEVACYVR